MFAWNNILHMDILHKALWITQLAKLDAGLSYI